VTQTLLSYRVTAEPLSRHLGIYLEPFVYGQSHLTEGKPRHAVSLEEDGDAPTLTPTVDRGDGDASTPA
jgi:hypothetical protein